MAAINKYTAATLTRIISKHVEIQTQEGIDYCYVEEDFITSKIKITVGDMLESKTRKLLEPHSAHALSRKSWFRWQKLEMPDWTITELHKAEKESK